MTSLLVRISETVGKLGGKQATLRSTGTLEDSSNAAYEPLATVAPEQTEPLQIEEGTEMGFDEQYEKPEGRQGDALAQVVAFVSYDFCTDGSTANEPLDIQVSIGVCHAFLAYCIAADTKLTDFPSRDMVHDVRERNELPVVRMASFVREFRHRTVLVRCVHAYLHIYPRTIKALT